MIKPALQDEAFLADVRAAAREAAERERDGDPKERGFDLWWLGQSGFLVRWGGRFILIDPYLSDSLTKKYASTDKPHVRMTERVVDPAKLDFVDVVTASHHHTDHLDGETLRALVRVNPKIHIAAPEAHRAMAAERAGVDEPRIIGMDAGESETVDGARITGVPAAHEAIERNSEGKCVCLGYVFELGGATIYHSGDTVMDGKIVEALRPFRVDVAILPINGRSAERRVAGNLNGVEAAQMAKQIGAAAVIPCHYDMFAFNTAPPAEFVKECERIGQPKKVLRQGERWSFDEGGER